MKINPEINIRRLQETDVAFCAKLVRQAGWNQVNGDWKRMMALDPEGCFVVEVDGHKAATIVFTRFDVVAWISMVLVDVGFRGRGIGQMIFGHVIERLNSENIQTIRLYATNMGVNLYRKYGFQSEYELVRLVGDQAQKVVNTTGQQVTKDHISQVITLDYKFTGTNRSSLINYMVKEDTTEVMVRTYPHGAIAGYVAIRAGRLGNQIGPCVAGNPSTGLELLDVALSTVTGQRAFIDIPTDNEIALEWAESRHFKEQRRFIRMYAGDRIEDQPTRIFASFGPEKG